MLELNNFLNEATDTDRVIRLKPQTHSSVSKILNEAIESSLNNDKTIGEIAKAIAKNKEVTTEESRKLATAIIENFFNKSSASTQRGNAVAFATRVLVKPEEYL